MPVAPPPRCPVALPLDAPGYFRLFVVCIGTSQTIQGNHIRFDSEENTNTSTDALNDAILPLTHPRILSIRGVATPSPHGTPNLSPIEPDMENGFSGEKSVNGSNNNVNKQKGGKGVKRKDSYTNRSKIMESTRVEKDVQQQVRLLAGCTVSKVNGAIQRIVIFFSTATEMWQVSGYYLLFVFFTGISVCHRQYCRERLFSVSFVTWTSKSWRCCCL